MKNRLSLIGSILGWSGVLVCCVSALVKLAGSYYFLGAESQSIFIGGIGLAVAGILAKIEAAGLN
jgi:hypothetical protein